MRFRTLLLALLSIFATAQPAFACRAYVGPIVRVRGHFDAVVVAEVTGATLTGQGDSGPRWTASARVIGTIEGKADANDYQFGRSGSSAACNDGQAVATIHEKWVLYLSRGGPGQSMLVAESLPFALAKRIDPRFGDKP